MDHLQVNSVNCSATTEQIIGHLYVFIGPYRIGITWLTCCRKVGIIVKMIFDEYLGE